MDMKKKTLMLTALLLCIFLAACGRGNKESSPELTLPDLEPEVSTADEETSSAAETSAPQESVPSSSETAEETAESTEMTSAPAESSTAEETAPETAPPETTPAETQKETEREPETKPQTPPEPQTKPQQSRKEKAPGEPYVICIDPGHQTNQNPDLEPNGPGSSVMKKKVSDGTKGIASGIPEYAVNLQVALQLKDELEKRGYTVIMTRTENDVNISNAERAEIANRAEVDAFLRLHCDGSEAPSYHGISILCQTEWNPYNAEWHRESENLAKALITAMCAETGAKNNGLDERDDMTGINWCKVPTALVEMGYLTNSEEEQRLISPEYQQKLVRGMADGLDAYLGIIR